MDTYTVGDTDEDTITTTRYTRFLGIISNQEYGRLAHDGLLNSDGSLVTGAEPLAALLVCDLIQSFPITDLGMKSEDFGGAYAYTRSENAANTTKSAFLFKYEEMLAKKRAGKYAKTGQARSDYQIEFAKLSQGAFPTVSDSSSDYPTM